MDKRIVFCTYLGLQISPSVKSQDNSPTPSPPENKPAAAEEIAVPKIAAPSETASPALPTFNGVPLLEIMEFAVVAKTRTPIYEIEGGDRAFVEAAHTVQANYPDSPKNESYPAASERYAAFRKLAKGCHPSKLLGYVRRGFIFRSLDEKNSESAPVAFPKIIGGTSFGAVSWIDYARLGNKDWRNWWSGQKKDEMPDLPVTTRHTQYLASPLTTNSLLLDPFDAEGALLVNTDGAMLHAWTIIPASKHTEPVRKNGGVLSVVETRDGLFLGYLLEKGARGMNLLTWEQAVADKNRPFSLKATQSLHAKNGLPIFTIFDTDSRTQNHSSSDNPEDFIVFPELYPDILNQGKWALKTSLMMPKDNGFEAFQESQNQTMFGFEIQRKLERVRVVFDALDQDNIRLMVISDFKKREVTRTVDSRGVENISAKPWQKLKEIKTSQIKLAADGAIRFTDGDTIYHLAAGRMNSAELTFYSIEKSNLMRPNEVK